MKTVIIKKDKEIRITSSYDIHIGIQIIYEDEKGQRYGLTMIGEGTEEEKKVTGEERISQLVHILLRTYRAKEFQLWLPPYSSTNETVFPEDLRGYLESMGDYHNSKAQKIKERNYLSTKL